MITNVLSVVAVAFIAGMVGFLVGQGRGLQLERNRARRRAAALVHPAGGITRPHLVTVPKDGA